MSAPKEEKAAPWSVDGGYFNLPSGNRMQATCHHRKAGACGGCYARMAVILDEVRGALRLAPHEGVAKVLNDSESAMQSEGREWKRGKR